MPFKLYIGISGDQNGVLVFSKYIDTPFSVDVSSYARQMLLMFSVLLLLLIPNHLATLSTFFKKSYHIRNIISLSHLEYIWISG